MGVEGGYHLYHKRKQVEGAFIVRLGFGGYNFYSVSRTGNLNRGICSYSGFTVP